MRSLFDEMMDEICEKNQKIADLEAKLAESFVEKDVEGLIKDREETIKFLKQQLAKYQSYKTTDEQIKDLTNLYSQYKEENNQLKQQLEEKVVKWQTSKIVELNDYSQALKDDLSEFQDKVQFADQDKISFAVAYLEIIKAFIIDKEFYFAGEDYSTVYVEDITEEIDNQIKQLKEGK